jgi:hypothetical protein
MVAASDRPPRGGRGRPAALLPRTDARSTPSVPGAFKSPFSLIRLLHPPPQLEASLFCSSYRPAAALSYVPLRTPPRVCRVWPTVNPLRFTRLIDRSPHRPIFVAVLDDEFVVVRYLSVYLMVLLLQP